MDITKFNAFEWITCESTAGSVFFVVYVDANAVSPSGAPAIDEASVEFWSFPEEGESTYIAGYRLDTLRDVEDDLSLRLNQFDTILNADTVAAIVAGAR